MGIVIQLKGTRENPRVELSGENVGLLDEKTMNSFGFNRDSLKEFYRKAWGKKPGDIFFNEAEVKARWNDQSYAKYGLKDCQVFMRPQKALILANETKPVALQRTGFDNSKSKFPGTFKVEVNKSVTNKISRSWDVQVSVGISNTISWEIGGEAVGGKIGGETTVSVESSYGESNGWEKEESLGYLSGAEVTLEPFSKGEAIVSVTDGYLLIKVWYHIFIDGHIWLNFPQKHEGHYFHFRPLGDCVGNRSKYSTEMTNIDVYSEGSIKLITL